jgi:energy-coupling factor transporter transmembrane protein EcfT
MTAESNLAVHDRLSPSAPLTIEAHSLTWLQGRSGYWWLDPRTKIVVLLLINLVSMSFAGTAAAWTARAGAMVLAAALLFSVGGIRGGAIALVCFAAGLTMLQYAPMLPGQWALLGALGTLVVQFFPIVAMASYTIRTTGVSEVVAALERLHAPQAFVIPLSVVLRFIPTIHQENRSIADAMRLRGISFAGGVRNPVTLLEYRVVPLLLSLVRIGDELTAAALTRGLGGEPARTHVCRSGFSWRDGVVIAAALVPVAIMGSDWVLR